MTVRLDTRVKRFGFVVMSVGVAMVALGCGLILDYSGGNSGIFWECFRDNLHLAQYSCSIGLTRRCLLPGIVLAVAGLLLSFAYDAGIGRIVRWINSVP